MSVLRKERVKSSSGYKKKKHEDGRQGFEKSSLVIMFTDNTDIVA